MISFKEYYKNPDNCTESKHTSNEITSNLTTLSFNIVKDPRLTLNYSETKKNKFIKKIEKLATSDMVISELSDRLGSPKVEETEDEFVSRGKEILREILINKINKK